VGGRRPSRSNGRDKEGRKAGHAGVVMVERRFF